MESDGPTASLADASTITTAGRAFSISIALTYLGLGYFGLLVLIASVLDLLQAVKSRAPLVLIYCPALLCLAGGVIYVMLALHQRRHWARLAAVAFWTICLIWTARTMARNGLHPEPAAGPLKYSNAEQLKGARRAALVSPYCMAILEMTALYGLLRKASVVNQFKAPGQKYSNDQK